ncbi:hypothetical protein DYI37_08030 [Fulvimarina endophytica]|uniref:Uncharacterized protein n=2 Tax=Fulvimarina endophytica TaxID=2293836 RepID=A0A371X5R2_9HYPH|nr:hypothetical protein DYI37_08030 [Fulvimarina endophytica]
MPAPGVDAGPADRALYAASSDYRRTVGEGAVLGALVGAVAGAVIGQANGGSDGALRGALIGSVAGTALGALGGTAVAETKRDYATREDRLDAEIANARAANAKLSQLVSAARRVVERREAEIATLRRTKAANAQEARTVREAIAGNRAIIETSIQDAERQRDALKVLLRQSQDASGRGALSAEAGRTEANLSKLKQEKTRLARLEAGL